MPKVASAWVMPALRPGTARIILPVLRTPALIVALPALAANAGELRFVTTGMSEGEALMKIGKPDSQSEDTGGGAKVAVKLWICLPAPGDSQTMTTIAIKNGKVEEVNRQVTQ
jgi:hypothetical protein